MFLQIFFFSQIKLKSFIAGKNTKCYLSLGSTHHTLHDLTNHITRIFARIWAHCLRTCHLIVKVSVRLWFRSHSLSPMSSLVHCLLLGLGQWFRQMMSLLKVCILEEVSKGQCCDVSTNVGCSLWRQRKKTGISAPDVNFLSSSTPARHFVTVYGQ